MPKLARLDAPGVLHHIMIRGIESRKIFRNDKNREDFLDRLSNSLPKTETSCYAWVFLSNHAHFLFRTGTITELARRLGISIPGVGYSVERGEIIARENNYRLIE